MAADPYSTHVLGLRRCGNLNQVGLSSGRRLISRTELVNMPARNISVGARIAAIWWLVVVVTL